MNTQLDLADIQGTVIRAYPKDGYLKSRYVLFRITDGERGRKTVTALLPFITSALPWTDENPKPPATTNIAFTYEGLKQLGLPELTLHGFPDEFSQGMKYRQKIVGDTGINDPGRWDPVWGQTTHMLIWINGLADDPTDQAGIVDRVETQFQKVMEIVEKNGGVELAQGHRGGESEDYQDGSIIYRDGRPTPTEHFGYTDGISDPFFKGMPGERHEVIGAGKPTGADPATREGWAPLETGEFILGHKDEAQEYPRGPLPSELARNGTYMVYRKLHQNVGSFNRYCDETAAAYAKTTNITDLDEARAELEAKFIGRWKNGAPLATFRTKADADRFGEEYKAAKEAFQDNPKNKEAQARLEKLHLQLHGFDFNNDLNATGCPIGAHIRRMNPRGSLEYGVKNAYETPGALANRRRIIRRGLPYGEVKDSTRDDGNHGIIIMILAASIKRQFEFVQQQWINYGNDFKLANDQDPILGNHTRLTQTSDGEKKEPLGRLIIQADPKRDKAPFFCHKIPTFVETKGGDYFFIPGLTALRMIGDGIVDPT